MAGLRQRQKLDRDRRIVEAAARLFREFGYEGVKIETIAEQAQVSVGTIYNYYESKGDVLVAVVSLEVNEVIAAGEGVLAAPPADAAQGVNALFGIYLRHSLHYLNKEMWRAAMSMSTLHPQSPLGRHYSGLDESLCRQVCLLLAKLKARGSIGAWVDVNLAGRILFNTMNMMFIDFVKDDAAGMEAVVDAVGGQTALIVSLLAAREAPVVSGLVSGPRAGPWPVMPS
ncbi:TetR/AcrR family transcriptional regulator [Mesorhizobium sp. PUT5]|uniref:TetR/AcrR family transcriptional regulator n=1 Tax=Mesorhizobium sp. PUT5 TaxID=3454629 RepID=UPI003FA4D4C5